MICLLVLAVHFQLEPLVWFQTKSFSQLVLHGEAKPKAANIK
jgi:hypothetical protein